MAITRRTKPPLRLTQNTPITIKRAGAGALVKGRWQKGVPYEVVIDANVQPAQFKDLMQMTEADRTKEWIKIYSAEEMRTAKEGDEGYEADIIIWEGYEYKVMRCRHYAMGVLDHWHSMAARTPISAGGL